MLILSRREGESLTISLDSDIDPRRRPVNSSPVNRW